MRGAGREPEKVGEPSEAMVCVTEYKRAWAIWEKPFKPSHAPGLLR